MHQHGHHRDGWIMTHDIEKTVRGGIGPTIPSESCDQRDRSGYDRAEQQLVTVRWCHSVDVELHKAPPKNVILCSSGPAGNVPLGSKCEELALSIRLPLCPPMADITQTWVALLDRARGDIAPPGTPTRLSQRFSQEQRTASRLLTDHHGALPGLAVRSAVWWL